MGLRLCFFLALIVMSTGCGSKSYLPRTGTSVPRSYNGTASVGDLLNITLDRATQTVMYTNVPNGDSGIVPYTVNANGHVYFPSDDGSFPPGRVCYFYG